MRTIKILSDEIRHNIHEAREKISEAYKFRSMDKGMADWYAEMAVAHLRFNDAGHMNVVRMINEAKAKHADNPMTAGMLAVYEEMHSDIISEAAEVKAMIDSYK